MKAKLIFKLPEDNFDYLLANSAGGMYTILHDLQQKLKYELKHNDDLSPEVDAYLEKLFYELTDDILELPCSREF
jgi:hypothetical protein